MFWLVAALFCLNPHHTSAQGSSEGEADRPNFLFVLADDNGNLFDRKPHPQREKRYL